MLGLPATGGAKGDARPTQTACPVISGNAQSGAGDVRRHVPSRRLVAAPASCTLAILCVYD